MLVKNVGLRMLVKDLANLTQLLPNSPIMTHKSFFSLESLFLLRKKTSCERVSFQYNGVTLWMSGKLA